MDRNHLTNSFTTSTVAWTSKVLILFQKMSISHYKILQSKFTIKRSTRIELKKSIYTMNEEPKTLKPEKQT